MQIVLTLFAIGVLALAGTAAAETAAYEALYLQYCSRCHGGLRYGGYAPPLIPQTLKRKTPQQLESIIRDGLPQTQMPAFGHTLGAEAIGLLAKYLLEPVKEVVWTEGDILTSRITFAAANSAYTPPSDLGEVILVVERGTGSITVLEGKTLRQLDKFYVGRIHGGPKFSRDYSQVFASTRDGTLVKYDLLKGQLTAQVKVAINTRNVAISEDGSVVAVANQLPQNLVVLDGTLRPKRIFPLAGKPSAVYLMPQGDRFILSLRDVPRLLYVKIPSLVVQEVELPLPFEDFAFVPTRHQLLASSRGGKRILLYDLGTGQIVHQLETSGLPHLFSATFFLRQDRLYAALNHLGTPRLSVIDMDSFRIEKQFDLVGAGYFARTHPGTPFLWVDTNTDRLQLFDKDSLTPISRDIVPAPGKKAMHVEFSADGHRALVSVWDPEGAVVVYDSTSLAEQQRLPFNVPVGKYNARNKTAFPLR